MKDSKTLNVINKDTDLILKGDKEYIFQNLSLYFTYIFYLT